uniref:Uncharacterized protein n=1 Tax=Physcomitrium patens TaxID=3218 RepID=A0A2K1ICF4_PHYPA|nr:hypothetical protein PHYPA_030417 [Physcomitrium patens]
MLFKLCNVLISWHNKFQSIIAIYMSEAKYCAYIEVVKEIT